MLELNSVPAIRMAERTDLLKEIGTVRLTGAKKVRLMARKLNM